MNVKKLAQRALAEQKELRWWGWGDDPKVQFKTRYGLVGVDIWGTEIPPSVVWKK